MKKRHFIVTYGLCGIFLIHNACTSISPKNKFKARTPSSLSYIEIAQKIVTSEKFSRLHIRYRQDFQSDSARQVLSLAENAYADLVKFFDFLPQESITIFLMNDFEDTKNYFGVEGFRYQGALVSDDEIVLVEPKLWKSNRLIPEKLIKHELVHFFIKQKVGIRFPEGDKDQGRIAYNHAPWIEEGLAVAVSGQLVEWGPSIKTNYNLDPTRIDIRVHEDAYVLGGTIFELLILNRGKEFAFGLFRGLNMYFNLTRLQLNQHLEDRLGGPNEVNKFNLAWRNYLSSKYDLE